MSLVKFTVNDRGSSIKYAQRIFRKTSIFNPLIRTRSCAYQGVCNISFSENFACVLNWWPLRLIIMEALFTYCSSFFDEIWKHCHCVKSVSIRSYSGPHFSAFGLNTERYSVYLCIQSRCWKIWPRTTPNTDTFCAAYVYLGLNYTCSTDKWVAQKTEL